MSLEELWQKALNKTEIKKYKLQNLYTFRPTDIAYILLSESEFDEKDTVVRKGKISVDKPMVLLPEDLPKFEGFDIEKDIYLDKRDISSFLFMRGIKFPSLSYNNELYSLDVVENPLVKVEKEHISSLEKKEDINTGLIVGPQECWQFSLLIYISSLITKSADRDIQNIIQRMKKGYN